MKWDVVIVGSGAGGAPLARELSRSGKKILLLEWGKDHPPAAGMFPNPWAYMGGFKLRNQASLKTKDTGIGMLRGICTGGTTMMFGGAAWDPPKEIFAPFGIDLSNELEEIKKEISIEPLPDSMIGPRGKLLMKSAQELGLEWKKIDRLFKDPGKVRINDASYFFGDKTGSRWCARDWVMEAVENGASLMNETRCEEVIIKNDRAMGVIATDRKGRKIKIKANTVVLSAGGVGSPVILQNSSVYEAGYGLFIEPFVLVFGYADRALKPEKEQTRQAGLVMDGIALADMALSNVVSKQFAFKCKKFAKAFKTKKLITVLVEISDDLRGIVTSSGDVLKPMSEVDEFKLLKGINIARRILRNAGAEDIWHSKVHAAHPGGTCRIGEVVDSNLKTQIDNLYVVDASVIPKSMAIPPALTIMALSKRLSKHLAVSS